MGKSTFLKNLYKQKNTLYYDLLDTREYLKLVQNPSILDFELKARAKEITHVIIDEIQKIPALLDEIHKILENPNPPFFILSGSSARKLKRGGANLLAGRALTFYMFPLTHLEIGDDFNLERALNLGTLPAVYLSCDADFESEDILRSYVETYLEEEIKAEAIVRNLGSFLRFLQVAAEQNGEIINYSNIARETANDRKTIKEYFQILEDTLIGFHLLSYAKSSRKKLIKHPKFYFFDTGVQRALTKQLSLKLEPGSSAYGKGFEHFIILEIIRLSRYLKKDYEFSFYRTNDKAEVDLIVETPTKKVFAIEIKSSNNPDSRKLSGLKSFRSICPKATLLCVSRVERARLQDDIKIIPWMQVFEELGIADS